MYYCRWSNVVKNSVKLTLKFIQMENSTNVIIAARSSIEIAILHNTLELTQVRIRTNVIIVAKSSLEVAL